MTNIIKIFITCSAILTLSGTAFADDSILTRFTYDASAPVEQTYARFQKTAERDCNIRLRAAGGLVMKTRVEKKCRAQLIANAVKATKIKTLIAYHSQLTKSHVDARKFARLRKDKTAK